MLTTLKIYISSKFTWQFSNLVHLFDMRAIKYNEHFVTNFQSMFFSLFNKNYITNPYCTCYYIMESMFVCLFVTVSSINYSSDHHETLLTSCQGQSKRYTGMITFRSEKYIPFTKDRLLLSTATWVQASTNNILQSL